MDKDKLPPVEEADLDAVRELKEELEALKRKIASAGGEAALRSHAQKEG